MKKFYALLVLSIFAYGIVLPLRISAQTWSCGKPFNDSRDSIVYNTVLIDNQCWMQQNLNYG